MPSSRSLHRNKSEFASDVWQSNQNCLNSVEFVSKFLLFDWYKKLLFSRNHDNLFFCYCFCTESFFYFLNSICFFQVFHLLFLAFRWNIPFTIKIFSFPWLEKFGLTEIFVGIPVFQRLQIFIIIVRKTNKQIYIE